MGIKLLILNNWKSYKGKCIIPVHRFAAIIGPNGAGKSNLMDAISFVLGANSAKLRGKKVRDQIHKNGFQCDPLNSDSASVEIVFENRVGEDCEMINFKRCVKSNGSSTYFLNEKVVKWEEYDEKLKEIGIRVRCRNFLVFQGDIESLATKSPKQITSLIEEVSGSAELAPEYEAAFIEKQAAEAELSKYFDLRKNLMKEKRQILEQKNEAENYQNLLKKMKKAKKDLLLAQYIAFKTEKALFEKSGDCVEKLKELKAIQGDLDVKIKKALVEQGERYKEISSCEENIARLKDSFECNNNTKAQCEEEKKFCDKRLSMLNDSLARLDKIKKENSEKIIILELQFHEAEAAIKRFEQKRTNLEKENLLLDKEKKVEYEKLQKTFNMTSKAMQIEFRIAEENIASIDESVASLNDQIAVLEARKKDVATAKTSCQKAFAELEKESSKNEEETRLLKAELQQIESEAGGIKEIEQKLRENEEKQQNLQFDLRTTQRDKRRIENYNALKSAFPDTVIGFVVDLIKPIAKRFQVAVMAALGFHNMDAIVVDTAESALGCIRMLKQRALGSATFLPLDSLKTKPRKSDYRHIDAEIKLLVDLVNFKKEHESLALFLFGNTLYAESLEKARWVCFRHEELKNRVKAVTKDGVVISKNGNMAGGQASYFIATASRFDASKIAELEKENESLKKQLKSKCLPVGISTKADKVERVEILSKRNGWIKVEQNVNANEIKSYAEKEKRINGEIEVKKGDMEKCKEQKGEREKIKNDIGMQIRAVRNDIFADFYQKNDIKNPETFDCDLKGFTQNFAQRRIALLDEMDQIREKLEFEKTKKIDFEYDKVKQKVKMENERLGKIEKRLTKAKISLEKDQKILEKKEKQIENEKKEAKNIKKNVKTLKTKSHEVFRQLEDFSKANDAREIENERLNALETELVIRAEMEQIDVKRVASERMEKSRRGHDQKSLKMKIENKKKELENIEKEVSDICPNLRSFEHFKQIEQKALDANKEFHAIKTACQEKIKKFQTLEQTRSEMFTKAFTHIEREIGTIYRKLTTSEKYPLGGNAYLTLENSEYQPFKHGTIFSAMPPNKRFREIESLSGGEKSIAALALLFAVHSFNSAPFFILDEIDAALDKANVRKVAAFIEEKTGTENLQCIVISLKDSFYHRADELIGVYRDLQGESSGILTLDLAEHSGGRGTNKAESAIKKRGRSIALSVSSFDIGDEPSD